MRYSLLMLAASMLVLCSNTSAAQERIPSYTEGTVASATTVDVIQDGSFEAGTPNAFWTEASTNFGTPLCDVGTCGLGGGTGPNTGDWWAWFGGIAIPEEGSVDQDVTLVAGIASLSFWLEVPVACDSPADYMEVLVDGTQEFLVDGNSALCGVVGYVEQTVNLDSYADGGLHNIMFHSEVFGTNGGISNFFVDDVVLISKVPVELVGFNATLSGMDVTLDWQTASETNNAGFEVQMLDGENWAALGFVEGHGTTTEAQSYNYTAEDMAVGTHTFRLKQIDFDGAFEYSDELEVTVETPGTHMLTSAYPNPFNPQSQFTLAVAQDQIVTAELFNTLGQRVAVLFSGTVEANQAQLVTIDGAGLASGMYVVRVIGERFSDALSVTLLK